MQGFSGRGKGFTLIELMIAVVVMTLLGAIAYPLYTSQLQKSRRVAAQATLLELAARQTEWTGRAVGAPACHRCARQLPL